MASEDRDGVAGEGPDFSELPEVVWVSIMSYLPLNSRRDVALTCHILNDAFNHPSLWYKIEINLLGDLNKYVKSPSGVIIPARYIPMIDRFGKYFQDLTLVFMGYVTRIPPLAKDILNKLSDMCRLRSLTLEVGSIITKMDFRTQRVRHIDLEPLIRLASEAPRLQSFNLRSWPTYPGITMPSILKPLINNKKAHNLEELSLCWLSAKEASWVSLNALLPPAEEMFSAVQTFTNLRTLCVRSTMLTDSIIVELTKSNHRPLEVLKVLVTYSPHDPEGGLPDIATSSWRALTQRSPDLEVDLTMVTRIPYVELAGLLKPEVPVAAVSFMKHSHCGVLDVTSITDKYHATLRKFTSFADTEPMDEELVNMVTKCHMLHYFIFSGPINMETVLHLAKLRGPRWYMFQVEEKNVITQTKEEVVDENCVIRQGADGEFHIVRHQHNIDREDPVDRQRKLDSLIQDVSRVLGQRWGLMRDGNTVLSEDHRATGTALVVSTKVFNQAAQSNLL